MSPLIYLLNHLFLSVWNNGYLFPIGFPSNTTLLILLLNSSPLWPLGALSLSSCVPLTCPISVLCCGGTSLPSGAALCSRSILNIFCHRPRVSNFSQELCFLVLENSIRNEDTGTEYVATRVSHVGFSHHPLPSKGAWYVLHKYLLNKA